MGENQATQATTANGAADQDARQASILAAFILDAFVLVLAFSALAGRLEQFEDIPGTGGVGLRLGGGYTKLQSATATAEYLSFKGQLVSRLEYRHDFSNVPIFGAGSTAVKDQDTFTLGEVFKF